MKISILTFGTIIAFIAGSTLLTSCGENSSNEADSTEQHSMDGNDHDELVATFACSMHPEITGKEGDKCSKCGMKLTAPNSNDHDMSKMDMSSKAKCPMHPEEVGNEGDKCSKCGMALVLNESDEHTHED